MATATIHHTQGDLAPPASGVLEDVDGKAIDIQGATVRFHVTNSAGEVVINAAANNDQVGDGSDGTKGNVSYDWVAADVAKSGTFFYEWEVTFPDAKNRSFPTRSKGVLIIWSQLA